MNYEHLKVYWSGAISWAWQNTKYIKWTSSFVLGLTIIYHLCDGAFGVNRLRSEVLWQWLGAMEAKDELLVMGLPFVELVPPHRHRYRIIKDFQQAVLRYLADHIGIQSGQVPTTPGATSTP